MRAPVRLGLYAAGLAALFASSYAIGSAVIPDDAPAAWAAQAGSHTTGGGQEQAEGQVMSGLSIEQDGYQLRDLSAPRQVGQDGTLSFRLTGPGGDAVTAYDTSHDKDLHLIVVRSDGAQFRHVHPARIGDGVWSLPWAWDAAGSYRVFADFVPTARGSGVTLTSTLSVAGRLTPAPVPVDTTSATVDGLTVTLAGSLTATTDSSLTFTVTRDGTPVTTLQPYLGAYGHLVALRAGDLGYLHVHPMGEPGDGTTEPGPDIAFMAQAPTDGKYLLYLDFQVDGVVHTAPFVVTAAPADGEPARAGSHEGH